MAICADRLSKVNTRNGMDLAVVGILITVDH